MIKRKRLANNISLRLGLGLGSGLRLQLASFMCLSSSDILVIETKTNTEIMNSVILNL